MAAPTHIGRGTVIRGAIRGDGDVEIDGRLEGALTIDGNVTIGDTGRVKAQGDISAAAVSVRGAVAGSIRGTSAVVLEDGARVVGDLSAPTIGIRPGGLLRGHVSTGESAPPKAVARPRVEPRREPAVAPASRASTKAVPPTKAPAPTRVPATTRAKQTYAEPVAEPVATKPRGRGAPAPVMPALKKGQKGQLKKRNA
jgi:cytoskeletal protein CcmA (bactofilin family)